MTGSKSLPIWRICAHSVRGASHARTGKPNQDCFHLSSPSEFTTAVAVADGHGSRKTFRSDRGSKFAAEIAVDQLIECSKTINVDDRNSTELLRQKIEIELPQRIVLRWQSSVDENLLNEPITEVELGNLSESERASVDLDRRTAYGTTLVAALLHSDFEVYLQIGDGDILVVRDDENDRNPSRPLPPDERSFANETASLAGPSLLSSKKRPDSGSGPAANFRVRLITRRNGSPPSLVLLTTDGYVNAFLNDVGFQKAATDILEIHRSDGWKVVEEQLPGWLEEASQKGSGDDVTVGVIVSAIDQEEQPGDATKSSEVL